MLSQELRPFDFDEVAGQEENIKILEAVIKNPDKAPKCIIFAGAFGSGKSTSARILARRLNNIKDRNFDLLNSQFYYEYDSTVIGNVETIRNLRDQFTISYGDYYRVIVFDECLHGDSYVTLSDGSFRKIRDIVNNKEEVSVKSYNLSSGKVENKRVIGWFKNSPKIFYKVRFTRQKGTVICSDNHRFITDNGEVMLKDLSIGSKVLRNEPSLSVEQKGFIIGTLLGDSSIRYTKDRPYACPRVTMVQGYDQRDWLELKAKVLDNIISAKEAKFDFSEDFKRYGDGFDNRKPVASINTRSIMDLKEIEELILDRDTGKKIIKRELLDRLTPAGIAAWYMDDGQRYDRWHSGRKHISRVNIHTSGFTESEQDIICDYFRDVWGIGFHKTKPGDYYFITTDSVEDTKKFYELIAPEMVEGVLDYKLPDEFVKGNGILNIKKGRDVVEDTITSIVRYNDKEQDSYDIEVEGNHNYFAGDILVHNCHSISNAAQNALLKVLEEAQGKVFFVMATTEPNKLLPTIRSRSLELDFRTVPRDAIIENLTQISERKNIQLSEEIKGLIADRSEGHMRNAHMLVDKYLLLGEQDFKDSIQSAIKWYCAFFIAIKQGKKEFVSASINILMNIPMEDLHADWDTIMIESMKAFNGFQITHQEIQNLVNEYGREHFKQVIAIYFMPWIRSMFIDMPYFQATMLNLYAILDKYFHPPVSQEQAKMQQQAQEQANNRLRAR